jgi:serine protease AprX
MLHRRVVHAAGRLRFVVILAAAVALFVPPSAAVAAESPWDAPAPSGWATVFVANDPAYVAATNDPAIGEKIVQFFGGKILRRFDVPGTFLADVPNASVVYLKQWFTGATAVYGRVYDCVNPVSAAQRDRFFPSPFDEATDPYSMTNIARAMGAPAYWDAGFSGQGVDVALIDTGVAPVGALARAGAVLHGPDLSFDAQIADLAHNDTFGHGTHMAGIINGVAPKSRIVSIKVGDTTGAVDVTQVIAAVDWVREHRRANGMNIRVLNLSYGLVSGNDKAYDELSKAIDQAWREGIVVIASTGNDGRTDGTRNDPGVLSPAYNRNVLAIGAYDTGASAASRADDKVATFSTGSSFSNQRNPDLAAPGRSVASLRVPNGAADEQVTEEFCRIDTLSAPGAELPYPIVDGGRRLRGSGTSQAAAAASGAAALILSATPGINPWDVKSLMRLTAAPIPDGVASLSGQGALDLAAVKAKTDAGLLPKLGQDLMKVYGGGALSTTRAHQPLFDEYRYEELYAEQYDKWLAYYLASGTDPTLADSQAAKIAEWVARSQATLSSNKDVFGKYFDAAAHARMLDNYVRTWTTQTMPDGTVAQVWNGTPWIGAGMAPHPLLGSAWSGRRWSEASWSGRRWSEDNWSGRRWSDGSWSGRRWSDGSWSGRRWSESGWSGRRWSDFGWSARQWW